MSILLTHGYFLAKDEVEQKIMMPYPTLGLLYISAYLDQHQIKHELFDTTFSTEEKWFDFVDRNKPEIIAFYVNFLTKVNILRMIEKLKHDDRFKDTKIILGGPDVTYNAENYLKHGADFLVVGEGEDTLVDLIKQYSGEQKYDEVPGLIYLSDERKLIKNEARQMIKDIDVLPIPNRNKINIESYLSAWKLNHGKSALNISTQRGCPYSCRWCSKAVYGQSYRRRSPQLVVDEIEELIKVYKPDMLWFVDDVFTINEKWINGLTQEMMDRNISIPFECITRAEHLNDDILTKLKSIGCHRIWIGAESGSQRILDLMDRKVKVQQVIDMIKLCKEHGIETGTFIMIGYPTETEQDIEETIQYLKDANPDLFTVTTAYPILGTELYEQVKDEIINEPDWIRCTDRQIDFKRTYPKKYYKYAIRRMMNEVYCHKEKLHGKAFTKKAIMHKLKAIVSSIQMRVVR
jgi:radical SAM superfamily enzyme YgiQ (UPF0313 family)